MLTKQKRKLKRIARVRKRIFGTEERPRIAVTRSNKYIYLQAIDDENGKTLAFLSQTAKNMSKKNTPVERAKEIGKEMAKLLKMKKVAKVLFDRRSNAYHGRIKAVAEGLRDGGIIL